MGQHSERDDNLEYDKHLMKIDLVRGENIHDFRERLQSRIHDLQLAGFVVDVPQFQVDDGVFYGLISYNLDLTDEEVDNLTEDIDDDIDDEF
ncbi:MAG TPA: hypothetical protein VNP04_13510 [Alphaproteobacteria bacterium]|nr:hypothetical protein [Alphaproteobacteria bacterium]